MSDLTPMMQQYQEIKSEYEDCILFFRMGDFYEMFNGDAETAARTLDIALTSRNKGGGKETPMAGVPVHSAEPYIADLIENDFKVAICEQLEDPEQASGLVERGVIRVITPGTVIENELLEDKKNNYLTAVVFYNEKTGFSFIDISTGEFCITEFKANDFEKIRDEIDRIQPREIICGLELRGYKEYEHLKRQHAFVENELKDLTRKQAYRQLLDHFGTQSLSGFGCENMEAGVMAAGQILTFLQETQKRVLSHINNLKTYNVHEYMLLDSATRRNLELTSTIRDNKLSGSLLSIIDKTITSMGGRLIKKWINQPLIQKNEIELRLNSIKELTDNYQILEKLTQDLDGIYDLERILGKITYESATARDLAFLRSSLQRLPELKDDISTLQAEYFNKLYENFDVLADLEEILTNAIVDDPPVSVREGGLIQDDFNEELDELRQARKEGKDWITSLQKKERKRTGINSLKVGFNKVFGYYIEVTKANLDKVPDDYNRKQTLTNSERYIIPELKEKEALVLGAEEKINELEYRLFVEIREQIGDNIERIKNTAKIISIIDVLVSLARVALENDYTYPQIRKNDTINIKGGRHPVVEKMQDEVFVPNDTLLDRNNNRFLIITGPNMSGKSTYMRQVALIVLLAQMGSFVPADKAEIGIVDRIFTRVGASDDLTTGQSTFMIEMNEVANIVNNATENSLIILDEVGRGTSTYDGVSIAWAVSEYINNPKKIGARSLFATHYHELTLLEEEYCGIQNYNVLVEEDESGVHFLYKIVPGKANESYGIEVARLAGLPSEIIFNARQILNCLEEEGSKPEVNEVNYEQEEKTRSADNFEDERAQNAAEADGNTYNSDGGTARGQLPLFNPADHKIIEELKNTEIVNLTPLEALNLLHELKQKIDIEGDEANGK